MEDQKVNSVAAQTEVPVSSIQDRPDKKSGMPKIDKKILLGIGGALVLIVIILGGVSLFAKNQTPAAVNAEYNTAFSAGDYEKAEDIAKKALNSNKTNAALNSGVINAIASQGNQNGSEKQALEQSQQYIQQALKTDPNNIDVLLSVGYAYESAGEYEKAREYYEKAVRLYPSSPAAWFHYGHVLQFLGKNNDSKKAYETAASLEPNNPQILIEKGNAEFMANDFESAKQTYIKASIQPGIDAGTKAEALSAASTAARSQWRINEAVELGRQAIEASPTFSPALGAYGYALAMSGKNDEGIDNLNKALAANPRITRNMYMFGIVLRANKKYDESINMFKDAINKVSNDNTIVGVDMQNAWKGIYEYQLANTYSFSNINTAQIIPLLQEAISLNPAVKSTLKTDFENNGYFKAFAADPSFLALIN